MKNMFAQVGKNIETTNDGINNKEYIESLKSDLIDRMIDSMEEYLNEVIVDEKGHHNYYIKGDTRIILAAFKEFLEIVYSNHNRIGVMKSTSSLNTDNFRYYFDSNRDELLHYCYYMALKEKEDNETIEQSESKTRKRVSKDIKEFHSNR